MVKNILITGISGMLGKAVYRHFKQLKSFKIFGISRQTDFTLDGAEILFGDLTSKDFLRSIAHIKFYSVIHCSAEINVNLCEIDKEWAYKSNVSATELLFSIIESEKYIYISTDSVFDGEEGNYDEDSFVKPLSYYAETKLIGEAAVKSASKSFYILRTNIYGFNLPMKHSLFEWGYQEIRLNNDIKGFSNMFFNPLYVGQLALFLDQLISSNLDFGTYNITANEKISKYDFLVRIAKSFDYPDDSIKAVEFNQSEINAPRALNTTLNNSKIKAAFADFDFSIDTGLSMLKNDFLKMNASC